MFKQIGIILFSTMISSSAFAENDIVPLRTDDCLVQLNDDEKICTGKFGIQPNGDNTAFLFDVLIDNNTGSASVMVETVNKLVKKNGVAVMKIVSIELVSHKPIETIFKSKATGFCLLDQVQGKLTCDMKDKDGDVWTIAYGVTKDNK